MVASVCDCIVLFVVQLRPSWAGVCYVLLHTYTTLMQILDKYFHAHACRGKKNVSFIWFILKNSIPIILALSAVTNFEIPELSTQSV